MTPILKLLGCQIRATHLMALFIALGVIVAAPVFADGGGKVRVGVPPWPGATIKSTVVAEILKPLGYDVKFVNASAPIVYRGLADGQIDVNLSAWSPGQAPSFEPYVKKGKVVKVGQNLSGAIAGFAVPDYVYNAGLQKASQISKFADKLDKKIYCIDPGSGANSVVKKGMKNNTYQIKGWKMVPSSTAAMLAQVKRAVRHKRWIMFCGWRPHWMNVILNMKYLYDSQSLWGPNHGHSQVFTLAGAGFIKQHPQAARFFRHFKVDAKTQSQWVYRAAYKNQPHAQVADKWISAHMDKVSGWLKGMKTPDGHDAVSALKAHLSNG